MMQQFRDILICLLESTSTVSTTVFFKFIHYCLFTKFPSCKFFSVFFDVVLLSAIRCVCPPARTLKWPLFIIIRSYFCYFTREYCRMLIWGVEKVVPFVKLLCTVIMFYFWSPTQSFSEREYLHAFFVIMHSCSDFFLNYCVSRELYLSTFRQLESHNQPFDVCERQLMRRNDIFGNIQRRQFEQLQWIITRVYLNHLLHMIITQLSRKIR